jgi:hypothetical protein
MGEIRPENGKKHALLDRFVPARARADPLI